MILSKLFRRYDPIVNQMYQERNSTIGVIDPLSRSLNGICVYLFILLGAHLLVDSNYLPLAALILSRIPVLGLKRPVDKYFTFGLIIYFVIIGYWFGAIILFIFELLLAMAFFLEMENVKRNMFESPHSYIPMNIMAGDSFSVLLTKTMTILGAVCFSTAFFTSGIFSIICWILFGVIALKNGITNVITIYYEYRKINWLQILVNVHTKVAGEKETIELFNKINEEIEKDKKETPF